MGTKNSICKLSKILFTIIAVTVILDIITTIIGYKINGPGLYNPLTMNLFRFYGLLEIILWITIKIILLVLLGVCTKLTVNKLDSKVVLFILYIPLFITYIGANLYTLSTIFLKTNLLYYIPEWFINICDKIFSFCVGLFGV